MPGTAFGAMMAMQRRSGVSTVAQNIHSTIGVPGSNSIKEVSGIIKFLFNIIMNGR